MSDLACGICGTRCWRAPTGMRRNEPANVSDKNARWRHGALRRAIMAAYLSALGVGAIGFWTIGLVRILLFGPSVGAAAQLSGLLVLVPFTFVVALLTTAVPFIVLRAVGLFFGIRCWAYFVVCGIFLGVAETAMLVTPHWLDWQAWVRYSSVGQNLALSGALGGLVYWWMAVRKPALEGGAQSRQG